GAARATAEDGTDDRRYQLDVVATGNGHAATALVPTATHSVDDSRADPVGTYGIRPSLACSVGIMAYNEAANIANAIETILHQHLTVGHVAELIVVASGCTDGTVSIVAAIARDDARVRLIVQERREG